MIDLFEQWTRTLAAFLAVGATYASPLSAGQQPPERNVEGIVAKVDGSKMAGACVLASVVDSSAGNLGCVQTDKAGRFAMRLRPGRYVIRAKDEAEGYPDPLFLFSADPTAKFPEIVVGESDISDLRVTLGARGGVLEGNVLDRATRLPIAGAKVRISNAREPSAYVEVFSDKDGRFQFAVPAKPIFLSTTATEYKNVRTGELVLSGGQYRIVEIELERK